MTFLHSPSTYTRESYQSQEESLVYLACLRSQRDERHLVLLYSYSALQAIDRPSLTGLAFVILCLLGPLLRL